MLHSVTGIAAARVAAFLGATVFGVGCAPAQSAGQHPRAEATAAGTAAFPAVAWTTRLDRDHALVGRIWSVRGARFVDESVVRDSLHGYVLLGEKHDNPDHHALQARLIGAIVSAGRRPVVAFEMFDVDDQPAIDASRRDHPGDAASVASAVHWDKSGWPPWENYEPIVRIALDHGLPLLATGLPRSRMMALMKPAPSEDGGAPPIDEGTPLSPEQEASLREELRESHCGHLPDARIGAMIRFQRARDASMAAALLTAVNDAHASDGVLVAGTGHTRRDRGAGRDLAVRDPTRVVTSIAFAEVEAGKSEPNAYASRWNTMSLPFDFVWFTPRATDEDPCAAFTK